MYYCGDILVYNKGYKVGMVIVVWGGILVVGY